MGRQSSGLDRHIFILCAVITLMVAITAVGCSMLKRISADEEIVAQMEEKYGEDFRFVEWQFQKIGSKDCTAYLQCDSLPGTKIKAGRRQTREGGYKYFDDYMAYQYEDEIQQEIDSTIKEIYPESRVIFLPETSQFPSYMDPGMSAREILEDKNTSVSAVILAKQEREEGQKEFWMELLREELEDKRIRLDAALFITEDREALRDIDKGNYSEWVAREEWYKERCDFAVDTEYDFYYSDWGNVNQ